MIGTKVKAPQAPIRREQDAARAASNGATNGEGMGCHPRQPTGGFGEAWYKLAQ